MLKRLEALNSKAKDPKKPVGGQLTMAEADEFSRLTQRQAAMMIHDLIESGHVRDIEVIKESFEMTSAAFVSGREPSEKDPKYARYSMVVAMRFLDWAPEFKQKELVTEPASMTPCTLEVALHKVEVESIERFAKMQVNSDIQTFNALKDRLPKDAQGNPDRAQMRQEDKNLYERLERKLAPAFREREFIVDLENLKGISRMAVMKYELQKRDAINSGGDIQALGQSMDRQNLDMRQKFFLLILKKIADDNPSEWSKNMELMTKTMSGDTAAPAQATAPKSAVRPARTAPAPQPMNIAPTR